MRRIDVDVRVQRRQPVLTFRNHRPVTESLGKNQVPVKTAPSIAIAKELEEKVKAEIQNKVSFSSFPYRLTSSDETLYIHISHQTHTAKYIESSTAKTRCRFET